MTVNWQDPPPKKSRGRGNAEWRDELRSNPGQWALIYSDRKGAGSGTTTHGKQGRGFETTSRVRDNGRFDIYIRYMPPAEADES